jgi:hypothetical protein
MSEKLPNGKKSRFSLHYFLSDGEPRSLEVVDKLHEVLGGRFPESVFFKTLVPGLDKLPEGPFTLPSVYIPPDTKQVLLIGIGMGGLAAYRMQTYAGNRGVSVFAVCPPPGVSLQPEGGPRVVIYGSKEGVYGLPQARKEFYRIFDPYAPDLQVYGIPSFIHGPHLAMYATAYLVGKYMVQKDLSTEIVKLTG